MGAGRIAWRGRWKVSDDKSVVELIQKRIDGQTAWILGGCIGPDPLAGRPIGPTYGQVMASESLTFAKLQETYEKFMALYPQPEKLEIRYAPVTATPPSRYFKSFTEHIDQVNQYPPNTGLGMAGRRIIPMVEDKYMPEGIVLVCTPVDQMTDCFRTLKTPTMLVINLEPTHE